MDDRESDQGALIPRSTSPSQDEDLLFNVCMTLTDLHLISPDWPRLIVFRLTQRLPNSSA